MYYLVDTRSDVTIKFFFCRLVTLHDSVALSDRPVPTHAGLPKTDVLIFFPRYGAKTPRALAPPAGGAEFVFIRTFFPDRAHSHD
ncbi:hypothetical protein EVAR_85099_1 [Eumeta japonica]|uniref:Uncharacterized protein n=1 Tax=Eumeta variegata TaxID=151549 RepID=A0A4C1XS03_EUMVA|nr:hypothetical protein EVAR_85099_1 [Eumeta japonica]